MKKRFIIIIAVAACIALMLVVLLDVICIWQIKFDSELWKNNELLYYFRTTRSRMVDDLLNKVYPKQIHSDIDLLDLLGKCTESKTVRGIVTMKWYVGMERRTLVSDVNEYVVAEIEGGNVKRMYLYKH